MKATTFKLDPVAFEDDSLWWGFPDGITYTRLDIRRDDDWLALSRTPDGIEARNVRTGEEQFILNYELPAEVWRE